MRRLSAIVFLLLSLAVRAGAQELPPCARPDSSHLLFPGSREGMERFARKLAELRHNPDSCVTIWQTGGSHIQAGYFSSRLRNNFDSLGFFPRADRGYIFPYPLAHTNYDRSYSVRCEGEWIGSRSSNPNRDMPFCPRYGILGIAAYTADSLAAFTLGMPRQFERLRIMGEASDTLICPYAVFGSDSLRFSPDTLLHGWIADFPWPLDSVRIEPRLHGGQSFTVTGMMAETPGHRGVSLVSTGVNGARTTTYTDRCPEFPRELALIHPDLVILGLGINDSSSHPKDFSPERFKKNYRRFLDMVKKEAPGCSFLFLTTNDSWRYRGRGMTHNDNGPAVRQAIFELAKEYDGAVWDLFTIMGGNGSAAQWRDAGLMKPDRLHFTVRGYQILGDMLYDAIMKECAL